MNIKTFFIGAAAAVGLAAVSTGAFAQADREPAGNLDELLSRIQQDAAEANEAYRERLTDFQQAASQQQAILGEARAELNALEARAAELQAQRAETQTQIDALDEELREAQGEFGELFGVARQTAGEFASIIQTSMVSAQFPGRARQLQRLSESTSLPTREELDALWQVMLREMVEQGRVVTFERPVSNLADGQAVPVTRVGVFALFAEGPGGVRFLRYNGEQNLLAVLDRQPPGRIMSGAQRVLNAGPSEVVKGPLDPSRGTLLEIQRDVPTISERVFQDGGPIGLVILGLLAVGLLLGLVRLVGLFMTSMAVRSQASNPARPKKGNPLGRVLQIYETHKAEGVETVELKLDEQILRENARLEMGLGLLKLIAAIAPLLGLLGTVIGMIQTFQSITLFGTGDPQIMADGISTALMTTVLGLVTAIPILMLHSFCASAARSTQQILDEQAAGLVAERAERTSSAPA